MKKSRFSEAQIIGILKEHQAGLSAAGLCRKKTFDTLEEAREFANNAKDADKVRIVRFQNGEFVEIT